METVFTETVWGGYYTHFTSDDKTYCFKTLIINPHHQISVQYHYKRNEVWYISNVSAKYELTLAEEKEICLGIKKVDIPVGVIHCIKNLSEFPLIISEMQYGQECVSTDIVRIYDPYNRPTQ